MVLLMAPDAVLWRFPGPEGESLRAAAIAMQQAGTLAGHLLEDADLNARLGSARLPDDLGCFEDNGACEDPRQAVLKLAGLDARVDATMGVGDNNARTVTLRILPADPNQRAREYTGQGATVDAALRDAVSALEGQGTIEVSVTPNDARIYLGDTALGTGSGRYPVPPGTHEIRAEAEGFSPLVQPIEVKSGMVVPINFILGSSYGELTLRLSPEEARATLNGKPLLKGMKAHPLAPGEYTLKVQAPGRVPHEQTITIKPSTLLTLTIGLPEEQSDFWSRFKTPHPDTLAHRLYVRGDLRFVSISDGPLDIDGIDQVDDSVGLVGLGVGVGYRGRILIVEALNLSYAGGGGRTSVDGSDRLMIDELARWTIRPGWVGLRYPSWRLEPYAMAGIELTYEDFTVEDGAGNRSESKTDLLLGMEIGLRGQIMPEWFLSASGVIDFAPGARTGAAFVMGVGYAFDLPGMF